MSYWNNPKYGLNTQQNIPARNVPLVLPHKCTFSGSLEVWENLAKFTPAGYVPPDHEPPCRECFDIKSFSQKSRMKLFTIFNQLNYSSYGVPLFLSATWHYDSPDTMKSIKLFLKKFRQMLDRILPPFHYIWKLEYQDRGVPHFHILIFPLNKTQKFYSKETEIMIKSKWIQLKQCKCKHCHSYSIKVIQCQTKLMSVAYISKEIAKVEDRYETHDLGRIWGSSTGLRINKTDSIICSQTFFNDIIDVKLKENFKQTYQIEYLNSLKDHPEPRSIFIDRSKILEILSSAKCDNLPKLFQSKKYILKRFADNAKLKNTTTDTHYKIVDNII